MKAAPFYVRARRRVTREILRGFFHGLSGLARTTPPARAAWRQVEVLRDMPYRDGGDRAHRLDLYLPTAVPQPWPVVLYVHGGGFTMLSKETHWLMGLLFAGRGCLVANISYRLAPRHPFPATVEDCCAAYAWLCQHAGEHGGDLGRLVLAGESAGANLVAGLALAHAYERQEAYARKIFRQPHGPRCVVAACGLFEVSRPERFQNQKYRVSAWKRDRIHSVRTAYLGGNHRVLNACERDFADPVAFLERGETPARRLPPFFLPVGTADPLLDDSERMQKALTAQGAVGEMRTYPDEPHAFHALIWREQARRCWDDIFAFLIRHGAAPG